MSVSSLPAWRSTFASFQARLRGGFKPALFQIHSWLGLTLGLVLAVMGVSGSLMAFDDQIVEALNPDVVRVAPGAGARLSADQLLARFAQARPDAVPSLLTLPTAPGASPTVSFITAGDQGHAQKLYLHPRDGHALSEARGEAFFAAVRRLHRFLLLPGDGEGWGRQVTGLAALALVFFAASGLYMRWPKRWRDLKLWFQPNLKLKRRGLYWSLHAVIGTWVLPIYLVIALTGLTWSYDWYKTAFDLVLTGRSAPVEAPARAGKAPSKGGKVRPSLDRVVTAVTAGATVEGGTPKAILVSIPKSATAPVRVRILPQRAAHARAYDEWRVDPRSGRILSVDRYAERSLGRQIASARLSVHRGAILGLPGAILFTLAAAAMPLFPITGYLLYLSRRKAAKDKATKDRARAEARAKAAAAPVAEPVG